MNTLLVLPISIPFVFAIASIINWGNRQLHRLLALAGALAMLGVAVVLLWQVETNGILSTHIGNWPPPFSIILVADLLSAIMVLLTAIIGLAVIVYSLASMDDEREHFGYYPLIMIFLMGMDGAFLTGDLFNLYVWFEIMLIASFALLTLGGERAQLEGGIKYFALNLLISAFFLTGVGFLYSITGALNMADLARKLAGMQGNGLVTVVAIFFLMAFGIKAAVYPMFFWLPASYHTAPVAVSAIFAGLLTKVGVYAMIRVFTLLFVQQTSYTHELLLLIAGFTMFTGVLGAVAKNEFRRILAFHSISQIGYMIMGLGLFTPLGLAGAIFFMIHHSIVKGNLFLISGVVKRISGSYDLYQLGGLYRSRTFLAILFFIPAFSLAGLPPLSGFWAKFTLVRAALEKNQYAIAGVALLVSLLTALSMTKIWAAAFWKPQPEATPPLATLSVVDRRAYYLPVIGLVLLTVLVGLVAEPVIRLTLEAANQLYDPQIYIRAVLGGSG